MRNQFFWFSCCYACQCITYNFVENRRRNQERLVNCFSLFCKWINVYQTRLWNSCCVESVYVCVCISNSDTIKNASFTSNSRLYLVLPLVFNTREHFSNLSFGLCVHSELKLAARSLYWIDVELCKYVSECFKCVIRRRSFSSTNLKILKILTAFH